MQGPVRVRFAPSPTGYLHVGGARTALFNWLLARKTGGKFLLRIEDTDQSRHVEDSTQKIIDDLHWLGLHWDEGPEKGGAAGPYFQSQRLDIYRQHLDRLLAEGKAYPAMESPEELAARREAAVRAKRPYTYRRPDPLPTAEQAAAARAAGRAIPIRFLMPATDLVVDDEILGEVRLAGEELEDFIILKGDGFPTYHFACVVDDELMGINFVIRGQEHLINTPKHIALQRAMGFSTPRYAHLPLIFNMEGTKMSKRTAFKDFAGKVRSARLNRTDLTDEAFAADLVARSGVPRPKVDSILAAGSEVLDDDVRKVADCLGFSVLEVNVHDFRVSGYLPEALLNFLSLLGWSPGGDREKMTLAETVELFDVARIGKTNARFDRSKLLAFNTDWCGLVGIDRLEQALDDFLRVTGSPMQSVDSATRRRLLTVCAGFRTLKELEEKCRAMFIPDEQLVHDPRAVKKTLARSDGEGFQMLRTVLAKLENLEPWTTTALQTAFEQLCNEHSTKLGNVAQPVRLAVTGITISPPIFDTLDILGRDKTLARIRKCLALWRSPVQN